MLPKMIGNKRPLTEGYSVGAIIDAAANNFRHHDEWAKTEPPSQQQLRSISVIAAVLKIAIKPNGGRHPFRRNVCPDIVVVLSQGSFEIMNRNIFAFANSMVSVYDELTPGSNANKRTR